MKPRINIIYISTSGNTKKAARQLAEELSDWAEVCIISLKSAQYDIEAVLHADIVGIGGPVFHLRMLPPIKKFIDALEKLGKNSNAAKGKKPGFFIFCTYAGITSGLSLIKTAKQLRKADYNLYGAMKLRAKHFYQDDIVFPDENMENTIGDFSKTLKQRYNSGSSSFKIQNKIGYQPLKIKVIYYIVPLFSSKRLPDIVLDKQACVGCKACVRVCPTEAIQVIDGKAARNKNLCIHCYQCAEICPKNALRYNQRKFVNIVEGNKKILGLEQPPNAVL